VFVVVAVFVVRMMKAGCDTQNIVGNSVLILVSFVEMKYSLSLPSSPYPREKKYITKGSFFSAFL